MIIVHFATRMIVDPRCSSSYLFRSIRGPGFFCYAEKKYEIICRNVLVYSMYTYCCHLSWTNQDWMLLKTRLFITSQFMQSQKFSK